MLADLLNSLNSTHPQSDNSEPEQKVQSVRIKVRIEGHLLRWRHTLIYINNIQAVTYWISPIPSRPESIDAKKQKGEAWKGIGKRLCIGGGALGAIGLIGTLIEAVLLWNDPLVGPILLLLAFFTAAAGVCLLIFGQEQITQADSIESEWKAKCAKAQAEKKLNIYLNSGWRYSFQFSNNEKLLQVYHALEEVFKRDGKAENGGIYHVEVEGDAVVNVYNNTGNLVVDSSFGDGTTIKAGSS